MKGSLADRLCAHAYGIERTVTGDYDRDVVAVLREAAEAIEPGSPARFAALIRRAVDPEDLRAQSDHERKAAKERHP